MVCLVVKWPSDMPSLRLPRESGCSSRTGHPPLRPTHSASGPRLCLFEHKVPGLFVEGADSEQITAHPFRQAEKRQVVLAMGFQVSNS